MRKVFLHLFIAVITFFFSLGLTRLLDSSSRTTASVPAKTAQVVKVNLPDYDEQKLREIFREYAPAQTKHDRAFFERVESDRFILFDWNRNLTREQDIRAMESWPRDTVFESEVESIRIIGDAAVVTVRMLARYATGEVDSFRCIHVCVRNGHSWQILSTTAVE